MTSKEHRARRVSVAGLIAATICCAQPAQAVHAQYAWLKCWETKKIGSDKPVLELRNDNNDDIVVKARERVEVRHADGSLTVYFGTGEVVCQAYREPR